MELGTHQYDLTKRSCGDISSRRGPFLKFREAFGTWISKRSHVMWRTLWFLLLVLWLAYFTWAMVTERLANEDSIRLAWVTVTALLGVGLSRLMRRTENSECRKAFRTILKKVAAHEEKIAWVLMSVVLVAILLYVVVDAVVIRRQPYNLVSFSGILTFILLLYLASFNPAKVRWRPVVGGLALQFLLALFILRWDKGYSAFQWMGQRISEFIEHTDAGSYFVFGENYRQHFFAFKIMPVVVYFSSAISILYYLGWIQIVIKGIGWVMQGIMATTAGESFCAAGNIFVGGLEIPLMIRPILGVMTRSELHAVLTSGMATIAGGIMAVYIGMGVPASHLMTASVMSAPAALAMSKLLYPETGMSKNTTKDLDNCMPPSTHGNILEAAAHGAMLAAKLVATIVVQLIAFIAMLDFLNTTLAWIGHRVGIQDPPLSFDLICSYLLFPLAVVMGASLENCRMVATLIGVKSITNEFVAYTMLSQLISNGRVLETALSQNHTYTWANDDIVVWYTDGTNHTLKGGVLTERSVVISTYALCGFSNVTSVGVLCAGLGTMAPARKEALSAVAIRALMASNVACFITACIAGLLFTESD